MELSIPEFESRADVSFVVIKAYILSLFFLVVFLAVGDAWTHYAEFVIFFLVVVLFVSVGNALTHYADAYSLHTPSSSSSSSSSSTSHIYNFRDFGLTL